MANPLDVMLRTYIAPLLKDAGFSKTGRQYRRAAESGDQVFVTFHAWTASPEVVGFYVNAGVAPVPYVAWLYRDRETVPGGSRAGAEATLGLLRVIPPVAWWRGVGAPEVHAHWGFERAVGGDGCGEALAKVLQTETLPTLLPLLDRRNLLTMVRERPQMLSALMSPHERNEVVLLVDEGPSDELEGLLRGLEALDPEDMVAVWARQRLATRAAAGS